MKKKAVITGATGFIGRHLLNYLHDRGFDIVISVRRSSDTKAIPDDVVKVEATLDDLSPLIPHIKTADYVYHLAGLTRAKNEKTMFRFNTEATLHLAELIHKYAKDDFKRFVFVSTQAVSKPSDVPICEKEECSPVSSYGRSKLEAETQLMKTYPDMPFVIVRPPSVYGSYDKDIFFYFKLGHKGFLPVLGKANRLISLVHIDDLIEGMVFAAEQDAGQIFYISNSEPISWLELAKSLKKAIHAVSGRNARIVRIPFFIVWIVAFFNEFGSFFSGKPPLLSFDKVKEMSGQWICDSTKICELGFSTNVDLDEGLRETYKWYIDNNWLD